MEQTSDSQRDVYYCMTFSGKPSQETLDNFGRALHAEGIRAGMSVGGTSVETLAFILMALPLEEREKLRESLGKIEFKVDESGKVSLFPQE